MDARKNAAIRKLKRSNNAWGKLVAKYEAEMFASSRGARCEGETERAFDKVPCDA